MNMNSVGGLNSGSDANVDNGATEKNEIGFDQQMASSLLSVKTVGRYPYIVDFDQDGDLDVVFMNVYSNYGAENPSRPEKNDLAAFFVPRSLLSDEIIQNVADWERENDMKPMKYIPVKYQYFDLNSATENTIIASLDVSFTKGDPVPDQMDFYGDASWGGTKNTVIYGAGEPYIEVEALQRNKPFPGSVPNDL